MKQWINSENRRWPEIAGLSGLALLALLPYINTLKNGFVYDDTSQVLNNPYIHNFRHLRAIFTSTVYSYAGTGDVTNYYRPMMHVLYLVCFQLFGLDPKWFHAANVLLHAGVVIALFKATERLFRDRKVALAAAALFALHPIHTEAVDWVAAAPDLLVALFFLLSFWAFLWVAQPQGRISVASSLGMSAFFVLALLSKESAVTLPPLATCYEHFYREDRAETRWIQKLGRYAPLWALSLAYLLFRRRVLGGFLPAHDVRLMPFSEVVLSAFALIGKYIWYAVWPVSLCFAHLYPTRIGALWPSIAAGVAALALLAAILVLLWKRARLASFGLLWFLVTLSPVLNARWIVTFSSSLPFAERYLYLPSIGLCWMAGWGFAVLVEKTRHRITWRVALMTAAAALAVLCIARVVRRNRDWRDEVTFYTRTLALAPKTFEMHESLGAVYYTCGDLKGAEREWEQARQLDPLEVSLLDNLGLLYRDEGRYDDAIAALKKSIRIFPVDPNGHINLGLTYRTMGDAASAEREFRAALALAPLSAGAHHSLGELYFGQKKFAEAAKEFTLSTQIIPSTKAYLGQGLAFMELSQYDQAEQAFKAAEATNPWDSRPHFVLGYVYGVNGKIADAVKEYQEGFKLDPDNKEARAAFQQLQAAAAATQPR